MKQTGSPRQVVILVYPEVQSLDVTGPLEVFTGAEQLLKRSSRARGDRGYEVKVLSCDGGPLRTSSGLTIVPDGTIAEITASPVEIDTLIVSGGIGSRRASADQELIAWISRTSGKARRTASVCTGAFLLAAAGLLDGRRVTTHWAAAQELSRCFPAVHVDPEPIFLRDGQVWTSAGVTAGMDLALALVEEDLDREAALTIARHLVLFLRRPGGQSQFSASLASQVALREPLREVQRYMIENVASDLSVQAMADYAHLSSRHFARAFRAETGTTPARYVERLRIEAARRRLEETTDPIATVAAECGFGTAETMRRVFLRSLSVGPSEYRRRFQGDPMSRPFAA